MLELALASQRPDIVEFAKRLQANRYDFVKLAYMIFPFGLPGGELEKMDLYDWQIEELQALSMHLANPATRYDTYRFICSSGNGAAKTALGAIIFFCLMYTQRVRGRITANTDPQMKSIVWPEYDTWFRRARFASEFFEKQGTSIKALDTKYGETWRLDTVTWSEENPAAISGLHNKGGVALYIFEEAPGIPAKIWEYAAGAFTETETIKIHLAFGNSDDPESKFEQNMKSPLWRSRRIDTRTLPYVSKKQIEDWLIEAGGNEDHDDFRVRVRGLPRKSARDSVISTESVQAAIARAEEFDPTSVSYLPVVLTCDPAWKGGDDTVIAYRQGPYCKILERFKLNNEEKPDHMYTYQRLCHYEAELKADCVFIDQAEGTGIWTLANNAGKFWELVSFANSPNDAPEAKDSQYGNIRAQMYYLCRDWLQQGGVLAADKRETVELAAKQLTWGRGTRHKIHSRKMVESKKEIKERVGSSPDLADAVVLTFARPVTERLPENLAGFDEHDRFTTGSTAYKMPDHPDPYEGMDEASDRLYR